LNWRWLLRQAAVLRSVRSPQTLPVRYV